MAASLTFLSHSHIQIRYRRRYINKKCKWSINWSFVNLLCFIALIFTHFACQYLHKYIQQLRISFVCTICFLIFIWMLIFFEKINWYLYGPKCKLRTFIWHLIFCNVNNRLRTLYYNLDFYLFLSKFEFKMNTDELVAWKLVLKCIFSEKLLLFSIN